MRNPKGRTRRKGGMFKKYRESVRNLSSDTQRIFRIIKEQEDVKLALKKSRDKFEEIFCKSPIGIELYKIDGAIIDANPASLKMFGAKYVKEWAGYNFFKDKHIPLSIRKLLKKKRAVNYDLDYPVKASGDKPGLRHFNVSASILGGQGNPFGYMIQVQDVTKQRKTDKELQLVKENLERNVELRTAELLDSENRYKKLFFLSPEPYVVISDEKLVNVNRACSKLFGTKNSKDLIGKSVMDMIPKEGRNKVYACMKRAFRKNKDLTTELRIVRLDGNEIIIELRGSPIEYRGKPAMLGIIRDITDRKRDERLLRADNWLFNLHNKNENMADFIRHVSEQLKTWSGCRYTGIRLNGKLSEHSYNSDFPENYWTNLTAHENPICACGLAGEQALKKEHVPELTPGRSYFHNKKISKLGGSCVGPFGSLALVPIRHKNQLVGIIHVADPAKDKLNGQRVIFLEHVATTLGATLKEMSYELELKKNNELLEKFFGAMNIMLAYLDKDLNFIRVNQAYARADNQEPDFFVGKNHFELFPSKENEEIFRNVLATGIPFTAYAKPFVYEHNLERGVSYWDWTLQRVNDENGQPAGLLFCLVDVTERRRTEERLLESYKHLGIINRKVAILLDLNKLRGGKGVDDITQFIVNSALKLSQAKSVSFYEYSKDGDLFKLRCAAGHGASHKSRSPIHARQCPILLPLVKKRIRVQGAFTQEQMACFNNRNTSKYNLFLPLIVKNHLRGCMQFEFSKRTFITTQELDFYEAFATQASAALEKIRVFRNPQQLKLDLVQ
jgi:PAS domain S-box-containing protein